jgi:hypothetical protein
MRRARMSIAAMRAASSICSHAVGALAGSSGWSKKSRLNCMSALLARRRFGAHGAKSVNKLAQSQKISEPAEILDNVSGIGLRHLSGGLDLPIGPACRDQRPAAVWQNCEKIVNAAPCNAANHGKRLTFEGMTLACDRYRSGNIMVMGSLWTLLSIRSITSA